MNFRDAITFTVACVCTAAVAISIVLSIYYGTTNSSQRYYAAMNECINARGSWVPVGNSGSCIMNRQ